MTVIRPNSVSGINSITAQADEIKVFKSNGTQGGLIIGGANLNATTGISTILALNVTGNVSIAGTLTYQDVTNVDSLGIGTFRTGINVSGGQLDVGSNIKIGNAGVITATSFSGSGANLTGIDTDLVSDTSPQLGGDLESNSHDIKIADNDRIYVGTNNDTQIYDNNVNTYIDSNLHKLRLQVGDSRQVILEHRSDGDYMAIFRDGGACDLYHSGTKRFETTSTGVTISGNANFANNNKAIFGTGNDAEIYHNDTDFVINAQASGATRNIYLYAGTTGEGGIYFYSQAGDTMFKALTDSSVLLYYDNSLKFRTMTDHCEIRGHLLPDVNNTDDLGSSSKRFRNLYVNDLQLSNEAKKDEGGNNVDGTWGDWTLQEGESDVYMINNRSGKKFKIKMEEVE